MRLELKIPDVGRSFEVARLTTTKIATTAANTIKTTILGKKIPIEKCSAVIPKWRTNISIMKELRERAKLVTTGTAVTAIILRKKIWIEKNLDVIPK